MVRPVLRLAGLALTVLAFSTSTAHAGSHVYFGVNVGIGVPAPVAVAVPPPPPPAPAHVAPASAPYGYVWRPGYYVWTGHAYRMMPGTWVRRPYAGAVWVAPRYVSGPRGRYCVHGYWHHR